MIRTISIFLAASAFAVPAMAQTTAPTTAGAIADAGVTTGATVYDTSGGVVGKIESSDGTNAVVNTGTAKAAIPLASFGKGAKGPVLALTKAQLEAQVGAQSAQADAAFKSKLTPGATVYGAGGTQIGTIKTATADSITITTPNGEAVLPSAGFGPGPSGVTIGLSADQLAAQMNGAAPSASTSGSTAASTPGTAPQTGTTSPGGTAPTAPATGTTTSSMTTGASTAAPATTTGMPDEMTTSDSTATTAAPTSPETTTTTTTKSTRKTTKKK